ncbi:MAG: hypothetical protein MUD00_00700 [Candidatus Pacebacteria bacterium]|jgi:chromosome segregation ATPase|nr:hypothetical protein [Candidatus Paceibacterota bacterium]
MDEISANTTSDQIQPSATAQDDTITQMTTVSAIEEEVAKELGTGDTVAPADSLQDKAKKLATARLALEEKIIALERDVKAKLAALKELKAALEEEIGKIKELKETEGKIDIQLQKIDDLEKKREEIENEIKNIEATTAGVS